MSWYKTTEKKSLLLVTLHSVNTGIRLSFGLWKSFLHHTLLLSSGYTQNQVMEKVYQMRLGQMLKKLFRTLWHVILVLQFTYNVEDLLRMNLGNMIPSIVLMQHTTEHINQVKTLIPSDLTPAPNTMKIHKVNSTSCGTLSLKLLSSQSDSKNFCVLRINKATNLHAKYKSILFGIWK